MPAGDAESGDHMLLASAKLNLGEVEAAWLLLQPFAGDASRLGHGQLLAFRALYDWAFGESPSYRAYMARIIAEERERSRCGQPGRPC